MNALKVRDWSVKTMHGNVYQSGVPDIYACHLKYGARWIEVKNPVGFSFTPAQMAYFPELASKNVGVWILMSAEESELAKLFGPPNWHTYLSIWNK